MISKYGLREHWWSSRSCQWREGNDKYFRDFLHRLQSIAIGRKISVAVLCQKKLWAFESLIPHILCKVIMHYLLHDFGFWFVSLSQSSKAICGCTSVCREYNYINADWSKAIIRWIIQNIHLKFSHLQLKS